MKYLTCFASLVFSLSLASLSTADLLEMADLIAHSDHYDRQAVVVIGTVNHVRSVVDSEGQTAVEFLLDDRSGIVKVTTQTAVQDGDQVIVEGVFKRRRQAGRIRVFNEVKANTVRPLDELNPDLVG